MSKKFLLIGHSVLDTIISGERKTIRPGGIFYSVLGLLNIKEEQDLIALLTNYDLATFKYFSEIYSAVDYSKSSLVENIPQVELTIYPDKERKEKFSHLTQKIFLPNDFELDKFDIILVNMITGFELTADELKSIKSQTNGLIYFDVHSLSRGIDKNNVRYSRKIPDSKEWLKSIDIIQANEYEILTLSDFDREEKIAEEIISYGVKIVLITKGSKGSAAYYMSKTSIEKIDVPAIKIDSVNHVGCGDIFGAMFSYYYSCSANVKKSLTLANKAAGIITSYNEISNYSNLKKDLKLNYE